MSVWWIVGGVVWAGGVFFAWAICKAAGDADERAGYK